MTVYPPAPSTEYPYAISDIAHKAAKLLGPDWVSMPHRWGTRGHVTSPAGELVVLGIDHDEDLYVLGPTSLEPVYLEDEMAPRDLEDLEALAEVVVKVIRDIV
ncbi:hypothetical protein ABT169_17550 [Streptomyces sp. NPDC001616]|uniref:hypothetical protein n=1 Tax=Streptomyces sp. NPDC001616 TaxID=3156648 RepID=UPI00332E93C7